MGRVHKISGLRADNFHQPARVPCGLVTFNQAMLCYDPFNASAESTADRVYLPQSSSGLFIHHHRL